MVLMSNFKSRKNELCEKLWNIRGHLKIELISFFILCPPYFGMIAFSTFELQKACHVNLNIDAETCDQLNNVRYKEICTSIASHRNEKVFIDDFFIGNESETALKLLKVLKEDEKIDVEIDEFEKIQKVCDAERDSQKMISKTYSIRAPIATTLMLMIVIFAGAWSDKHNIRKIFIVLPFIGEIFGSTIYIMSAIFYDEIPIDVTIYASSILSALCGGRSLYTVGIDSYLAITTSESYRTFRIGFYSMFRTALGIFASPLGGVFFEVLSYKQLFTVNLVTQVIGLISVIFLLSDVKATDDSNSKDLDISLQNTLPSKSEPESLKKKKNFCIDFFDPSHIKDAFTVLKVPRPDNKRKILLFVIILNFTIWATVGEDELYILYGRKALNWTTEFSMFVSYYTVIGILGTGIAIIIFSKALKMSDPMLAIISIVGSLAANPILAFAHSTMMAYIGVTVDFFYYVRFFIIKSMISKLVEGNEMGRVFSLLGITENVDSIIFTPIYGMLYYYTLEWLPGAFFLFSNLFLLIALLILLYLRRLYDNVNKKNHS